MAQASVATLVARTTISGLENGPVDAFGSISRRWSDRMLHLVVGRTLASTPVTLLRHGRDATALVMVVQTQVR